MKKEYMRVLKHIGIALVVNAVVWAGILTFGLNYINDKIADVSVKIINAKVDLENVKPKVKEVKTLNDSYQDKMLKAGENIADVENEMINDINFDMDSADFKKREDLYAKYANSENKSVMWFVSVAPAKWSYLPTMQGNGNKIGMWLCEANDIILAYATADFDVTSNKFTNFVVQQTQEGVNSTPITGTSFEESQKYYRENGARW